MALNRQELDRLKEITAHIQVSREFFDSIMLVGACMPGIKDRIEAQVKAVRDTEQKMAFADYMNYLNVNVEPKVYTRQMFDKVNYRSVNDINDYINKVLLDGTE